MPWYLIEITPAERERRKDIKLEQLAQTVWDRIGKKSEFALFGKHKIGDPNNPSILYYLSPEGHKHCSEGNLIWMQPRVLDEKPLREGLDVIVGYPEALKMLD
jgi:hypothetical protein